MDSAGLQINASYSLNGKRTVVGYDTLSPPTLTKYSQVNSGLGNAGNPLTDYVIVEGTLAAGANFEHILNNGSLVNRFGETVTFVTLKYVAVELLTGAVGLRVGNAGTNPHLLWFQGTTPAADVLLESPPFLQGDKTGKVVSAGANRVKILNLDGAAACTYRLFVGGLI